MTECCYMKLFHTKFNQNVTVCNGPIHKKSPDIQAINSTPQLHFDDITTHAHTHTHLYLTL